MTHEAFRELLQLAVAEEISGEEMRRLREHLSKCDGCRTEFQELQQLKTIVGECGVAEPTEQMLWESRRRLFEAIRGEASVQSMLSRKTQSVAPSGSRAFFDERGSTSLTEKIRHWVYGGQAQRMAFGGALAILLGIMVGYFAFGSADQKTDPMLAVNSQNDQNDPIMSPLQEHELGPVDYANVRFVETDAKDGQIELQYDLIRPVRLKADVDDERMQRMLAYALRNEENDGVRLRAVNAFDASPVSTSRDSELDVKQSLIEAVMSDPNPGVRRQALVVLQKFPFDDDIKRACIGVLENDRNPGMRVAAVGVLGEAAKEGATVGPEVYDMIKEQYPDMTYLQKASMEFIEEESNDAQ